MNQIAVAGVAAAVVAASAFGAGVRWQRGAEALAERTATKAADAATVAATEVIKGLRPQFTTINRGVERETRTEIRYTDCVHTPAAWGLLDRAYQAAGGEPFGDRAGLPVAAPAE